MPDPPYLRSSPTCPSLPPVLLFFNLTHTAGDCVADRENRKFEEGLNSKVKLSVYKTFVVEYLHGVSDAASKLMFKFRSGTHGLNEELGRHRGREGMKECLLCDNECESVSHVLWECPAYSSLRDNFLVALQETFGNEFEHFQALGKGVLCVGK